MATKTPNIFRSTFGWLNNSLSIRYTIPVIIVTPLLAAIGAIGWLTFQGGQQEIDKLIYQVSEKSTAAIELNVDNYLDSHKAFLDMQLAAVQSGNLNLNDFPKLEVYFWNQLRKQAEQSNSVYKVFIGTEQGEFLGVEREENIYVVKIKDEYTKGKREFYQFNSQGKRDKFIKTDDYDPRSRLWYKEAQKTGKITWTGIYKPFNIYGVPSVPGVGLAIPIFEQKTGNLQAVLATDVTLNKISDFMGSLAISPTGTAFIIDRSGNILASSSAQNNGQMNSQEEPKLNVAVSSDPLIKATGEYILNKFTAFDQIQGHESLKFSIKGEQQFVQITPLKKQDRPDWLLVVVIPKADFMQHIYAYTKHTIIVGILVTVLAIMLALVTVRWIINPIKYLYQAAQDIQSEKFEPETLETVAQRGDEFGKLAKVFLVMAQVIYSREQNWKQMMQQLKTENSQSKQINSSIATKEQAIYLEQLLKKAQRVRQEAAQLMESDSWLNSPTFSDRDRQNKG